MMVYSALSVVKSDKLSYRSDNDHPPANSVTAGLSLTNHIL